jgi:hypothetical protein
MGFRLAAILLGFTTGAPVLFPAAAEEGRAHRSGAAQLEDARWARPGADIVRILTTSPGECLKAPETADGSYEVEIGRAAFRTPLLFGGTAARAGLSCNSCHRDGRDNPDFFLEGLSGAPGTADVTSSMFSKVREDGVFNPLPIPTLVDAGRKSSFGASSPHGSIEAFVASAVDEEFGGAPPPAVISAIARYVSRLDSAVCPASPERTTLRLAMSDVRRALLAAAKALERGDAATADFLLVAAREGLGRVYARMPGDDLENERAALARLSASIAEFRKRPEAAEAPAVIDDFDKTFDVVRRARKKTLYEPKALRRRLAAENGAAE